MQTRLMVGCTLLLSVGIFALAFVVGVSCGDVLANERPRIPVGAAKVDVMPTVPVVLAGYGGRTREYEGIDTKLWARAMVIGDEKPVVVVAIDNCGVPQSATDRLAERLKKRGIAKDCLIVAATHTHYAPTLTDYAPIVWQGRTTAKQDERTAQYTTFVIEQMEKAVVEALANRQPMTLEWAQGRVSFGGNRRVVRDGRWATFGFQRDGPVDHSLPVLAARDASGTVRVVWSNYACHCTTLASRNRLGGDWAGFANESMEKKFPKAVSLMTIGCGADVGPLPWGSLEIARKHGRSIAEEVARLLSSKTTPLTSAPVVSSRRIQLPLEKPRSRKFWEAQLRGTGGFHHQLAKLMLKRLDKTGSIASEVDYPVSVWKFGDDLAMVFLGGEVVVDYSLRLKSELDWKRLWITAWANDVPGYIPSRRVLAEGGYETDLSQVYYGQPGRYDPRVEEVLVGAVTKMVGKQFAAGADATAAPYHKLPSGEDEAFARLADRVAAKTSEKEADIFKRMRRYLPLARPAVGDEKATGGETGKWNNFAGDFVDRAFIRQQSSDAELRWKSPVVADTRGTPRVFCFSGGVGWESDPKTDGFALLIGGKQRLTFAVTRKLSRWSSEDGSVELIYLPTWTSGVDSGGFFLVVLSKPSVDNRGGASFAVRSLGKGSRRWFAIDSKQDMPARLSRLRTALGSSREQPNSK